MTESSRPPSTSSRVDSSVSRTSRSSTRTPVAFIIFNRPDLTARVFESIARARPETLLVIADGPRPGHPEDAQRCAATRAVIERVDWPCRVLTNYSEENLGCGVRPATGMQWVFEQVEEAIILEDDCLPHPDFFHYCDELLERYRHDERVMHISGNQFLPPNGPGPSYAFSRYTLSWGWATWKRAFEHYDYRMSLWPELRETSWLADLMGDERLAAHWTQIFDRTYADQEGSSVWDYQWVFTCWAHSGLSLLPRVNLVSNIGFRGDATHTTQDGSPLANIDSSALEFPLRHPAYVHQNVANDRRISDMLFGAKATTYARLREKGVSALPPGVRTALRSVKTMLRAAAAS